VGQKPMPSTAANLLQPPFYTARARSQRCAT
jgi:hypothetical protein